MYEKIKAHIMVCSVLALWFAAQVFLSVSVNLLYKWHGRGYCRHQFYPLFSLDLDHEDFPMLLSNSLKNAILMAI